MTYTATIEVVGKTFTSDGSSVVEAIRGLKPGNVKGAAVLTISNGETTRERILPRVVVQRLFNLSPTMREMALKNVSLLFDL